MVIIAAGYSSDRMSTIDARYSGLLDKDVKALQNVTLAQAHNNKFGLFLYKEIAELNPDRMRVIDADIDQSVADFHAALNEAKRRSPDLTSEIDAAAALFDREVAESRLGVWKRTLHQFLEAQKNGSPNQLADGLLGELAHWSARGEGEDLDDDITMVTIRVTDTC